MTDTERALDALLEVDASGTVAPYMLRAALAALGFNVPAAVLNLYLVSRGAFLERSRGAMRKPMWRGLKLRQGAMTKILEARCG